MIPFVLMWNAAIPCFKGFATDTEHGVQVFSTFLMSMPLDRYGSKRLVRPARQHRPSSHYRYPVYTDVNRYGPNIELDPFCPETL